MREEDDFQPPSEPNTSRRLPAVGEGVKNVEWRPIALKSLPELGHHPILLWPANLRSNGVNR